VRFKAIATNTATGVTVRLNGLSALSANVGQLPNGGTPSVPIGAIIADEIIEAVYDTTPDTLTEYWRILSPVDTNGIIDSSVTTGKINDGAITDVKVNDVSMSKLTAGNQNVTSGDATLLLSPLSCEFRDSSGDLKYNYSDALLTRVSGNGAADGKTDITRDKVELTKAGSTNIATITKDSLVVTTGTNTATVGNTLIAVEKSGTFRKLEMSADAVQLYHTAGGDNSRTDIDYGLITVRGTDGSDNSQISDTYIGMNSGTATMEFAKDSGVAVNDSSHGGISDSLGRFFGKITCSALTYSQVDARYGITGGITGGTSSTTATTGNSPKILSAVYWSTGDAKAYPCEVSVTGASSPYTVSLVAIHGSPSGAPGNAGTVYVHYTD
jgi:hypothetical protein